MRTIRDYIKIVEELSEASWWPETTKTQAPGNDHILPMTRVMANSIPPRRPMKPTRDASEAITALAQAGYQQHLGRDHYDEIVHLASTLRDMAHESGMDRFIPLLNRIAKNPDDYQSIENLDSEFKTLLITA